MYQKSDEYNVNKYIYSDTFGIAPIKGGTKNKNKTKIHKYQDPVELYIAILKMFKDCISVLDPFMGSGTTAIAAKSVGLTYYGFEMDIKSWQICTERLKNIS